jgi:RND family efflux transporter MFP subunit
MASVNRVLGLVAVMGGAGFGIGFATPRWAAYDAVPVATPAVALPAPAPAPTPASVAAAPASAATSPPPAPAPAPATAVELIGVLVNGYAVELQPKVEGKVESVLVHVGDRVSLGTPLANVDVTKTRQDLEMTQAELRAEEATCHDAELQLQRRIPLGGRAISREEVDSARAQARVACSKLQAQEARVRQLTQALADAEMRAPFDGVVTARYVDPGAVVGPGKPVLRLLGEGNPQVRFGVPDDVAAQVQVGRPVRVTLQGRAVAGVISRVAPEEDSSSHMIFAVADVETPPGSRLPSGVVVRVIVASPPLALPPAAPAPPDDGARHADVPRSTDGAHPADVPSSADGARPPDVPSADGDLLANDSAARLEQAAALQTR